jgi:hypothetical protein
MRGAERIRTNRDWVLGIGIRDLNTENEVLS